jgi:RNA-dependent RNA polymerase
VPSVDISNRVIRRYINLADNFLRVRFTDEKHIGRIHATTDDTMDEVLTRIKRALANGITIGSTRYEFLAFGNSQFREHGAYFFAPRDGVTAAKIRAWMGQFTHIRSIAKHTARLGQCFSTTRAISGCTAHVKKIDDIERIGYIFSDGVGRISRFLAQIAKSELKIKTLTKEPPSAYQFRLGGCKGMLIVSPEARPQEVHIRKSQFKFAALSQGLEIIRWSQFAVVSLSRQLILVLSTLGIADEVFHLKRKTMLRNLDEAMESDPKAAHILRKYVDPNQITLTVSQMVLDGFRRSNEPFVSSLLTLWRAWHLKHLKEKAKIAIAKGACVLGCMDETATLQGYFSNRIPRKDARHEEKVAALPEIFLQVYIPEDGGKYEIIEGICILARNPSLHPGDIRVVRAVNAPGLHHLKDIISRTSSQGHRCPTADRRPRRCKHVFQR